jgi:Cu+-exporting ATPase
MFTSSLSLDSLKALASAKDPVCQKQVDATQAAAARTAGDKTFYFCGSDCIQAFDADPAKYVNAA